MSNIIEIKNLNFSFKENKQVLKDINFNIKKGEVVGLIGLSGCGKTTLCQCLCGIIPKVLEGNLEGQILLNGKNINDYTIQELSREIGFVMQDANEQIVANTVEDELAFSLENFCIEPENIKKRVDIVLKELEIENLRFKNPNYLSGGQKQLVSLAAILTLKPKILILDEPMSHLDTRGKSIVKKSILSLKDKGHTIILVEHDLETIKFIDKVLLMKEGSVLNCGEGKGILEDISFFKEHNVNFNNYKDGKKEKKYCDNKNNSDSLVLENISFSYPHSSKKILQNFNEYFNRGEVTAITGSNGCGKTTLTKIIVGILQASSGRVILEGEEIINCSLSYIGKNIGYVMQNPNQQIFSTSVEEEVEFGLKNMKLLEEEIRVRVEYYLKYFELFEKGQNYPFHLSKGEKQRLVLASVLAMQPRYLILDEPTASLDIYRSRLLGEYLVKISEELSCGIILVSHDRKFTERYCDREVVMPGEYEYEE